MFAVFSACGKQYLVSPGDVIYLDAKLGEVGKEQDFNEVLLVNGKEVLIGKPLVKEASVTGEVLKQMRGPKLKILKMRRRKNALRKIGHRQDFTRVLITQVSAAGENLKLVTP